MRNLLLIVGVIPFIFAICDKEPVIESVGLKVQVTLEVPLTNGTDSSGQDDNKLIINLNAVDGNTRLVWDGANEPTSSSLFITEEVPYSPGQGTTAYCSLQLDNSKDGGACQDVKVDAYLNGVLVESVTVNMGTGSIFPLVICGSPASKEEFTWSF